MKKENGYIALMATIVISIILLMVSVEEGRAGWFARFALLGTEAYEEARALAKGCADRALLRVVVESSYTGDATSSETGGTCHIFHIARDTPTVGLVTVRAQAVVRGTYGNSEAVYDLHDIHTSDIPLTSPVGGSDLTVTPLSYRELPQF